MEEFSQNNLFIRCVSIYRHIQNDECELEKVYFSYFLCSFCMPLLLPLVDCWSIVGFFLYVLHTIHTVTIFSCSHLCIVNEKLFWRTIIVHVYVCDAVVAFGIIIVIAVDGAGGGGGGLWDG